MKTPPFDCQPPTLNYQMDYQNKLQKIQQNKQTNFNCINVYYIQTQPHTNTHTEFMKFTEILTKKISFL